METPLADLADLVQGADIKHIQFCITTVKYVKHKLNIDTENLDLAFFFSSALLFY